MTPEFWENLIAGSGPYMGGAAFVALLQVVVIRQINDKSVRQPLLFITIIFQLLALAAGMIVPFL